MEKVYQVVQYFIDICYVGEYWFGWIEEVLLGDVCDCWIECVGVVLVVECVVVILQWQLFVEIGVVDRMDEDG